MELGLDMTRSDELGDLEGVGVGGGEHTGPKDQVVSKVTNTNKGRTWAQRPRGQDGDQETLQVVYIYC